MAVIDLKRVRAGNLLRRIMPLLVICCVWWLVHHGRWLSAITVVLLFIFVALAEISETLRSSWLMRSDGVASNASQTTKEVPRDRNRSQPDQQG